MKTNILVINAALGGSQGNTQKTLNKLVDYFGANVSANWIFPGQDTSSVYYEEIIRQADGIVFGTGTYWDSWSSRLQKFLEDATAWESSKELLFGKPASVVVTEHSCGGKGILSRLQGVLSTFGMMIPPMSGIVYSAQTHSLNSFHRDESAWDKDIWTEDDLEIVAHNLIAAASRKYDWRAWEVSDQDPKVIWNDQRSLI